MPGNQLVQSLSRGLEIVRLVSASGEGLRLTDIADALAIKPSTAHNLARTLRAKGFLHQLPNGSRYVLGQAIAELAESHRNRRLLRDASEVVRRLSADFPNSTITFAELTGSEATVRLRMSPERPGVLEEPVGRFFQPFASASGLTFQAYCTAEEREAIRRRYPFAEYGAHLWGTRQRLELFLQEVRQRGVTAPRFKGREQLPTAAPVMGAGNQLVATIGASVPQSAGTDDGQSESRVITAISEAAAELSAAK